MSDFSNLRDNDIFLWADGYWCYRGSFHDQPRQTYAYRLVMVNTAQWDSLTGAEPYTRFRANAANDANRIAFERRTQDRRHS